MFIPVHDPVPVSYTHLDVYKRQELSRLGSGPAVYYQFSDLKVPVGFISAIPVSYTHLEQKSRGL